MKFFTRAWCTGQLDDTRVKAVKAAYWAHVDEMSPRLPATVVSLAPGVNVHDGLFRSVRLAHEDRRLDIVLRCGDVPSGYFDLTLPYGAVYLRKSKLTALTRIAEDPRTERSGSN